MKALHIAGSAKGWAKVIKACAGVSVAAGEPIRHMACGAVGAAYCITLPPPDKVGTPELPNCRWGSDRSLENGFGGRRNLPNAGAASVCRGVVWSLQMHSWCTVAISV